MLDFETDERLSSVSITEPTGVEDGRGDTGDKTGVVGVIHMMSKKTERLQGSHYILQY